MYPQSDPVEAASATVARDADRARRPRILLMAVPALGDVLLCTPLLAALRRAHERATIHVLVRKGHADVLEGNTDVDDVLEVDKHPTRAGYSALLKRIFRSYDLFLSNSTSDRAAIYALLASRRRVSVVPPRNGAPPWKRWLYDCWTELDTRGCHTLVQTNRLGELIGLAPGYDVRPPESPGSEDALAALLGPAWRERPLAVLHPAPALRYKRWHAAGWRAVARHFHETGMHVVVTSGPGPEEVGYVENEIGFEPAVVTSLAGRLRLGDLSPLLRGCSMYVGVDTLVTHIAAAVGAPTIALFGPTNPTVWGPWPKGHSRGDSPYRPRGSQRVGNVYLLQGPGRCVPCGREGCLDRRDSHSDCLDLLPASVVIDAIDAVRGGR